MQGIPKIIHQMWIGPPCPYEALMETWRTHHPDWEYRLWTEENLQPMANQDLWDRAYEISPGAPEQFRSDVARYEILAVHGGVWVDADFTCQRPIDGLCTGTFAGLETGAWLNNALIGGPAFDPLWMELVERLPQNVARRRPGEGNTVKSGPQFFTPIARRHEIIEYPSWYFYPYSWRDLDAVGPFPHSYAVHHWGNRRRMRGKPLETV